VTVLDELPPPQTHRFGLLPEARHVAVPAGIVSTGFPAVRETCREIGVQFDPWQVDLNTLILAKGEDGLLAADTVSISICRQAGKTYDIGGLVFADAIIHPGTTTVWTAHRFKVARETFDSLRAMARSPLLAAHIDYDAITTAAGNETIPFRNGSRIVFAARERGTIRGFSKVRRLILDEGQILTESAMADLAPTMNQAVDPQIIIMGTPPKPTDPGEFFTALRDDALAGTSEGVLYVEFGAEPGSDLDDPTSWARANPSFPHRTSARAIRRLRKLLTSDDDFAREALGIWDQIRGKGVLPASCWKDSEDPDSVAVDRFALGVECGPDLAYAAVSLAGQRADGQWHVELDEDQHTRGSGTSWLAPHVQALVTANPQIRAVVVDVAGPIAALLEQRRDGRWFFKDSTLEVTPVKVAELGASCSLVLDGVVTGWLHHIGQPQFTAAALSAGKRPLGDTGKWVWSRKSSTSDITPIQAATLALAGAQNTTVKKPSRSTTGRRAAVVL